MMTDGQLNKIASYLYGRNANQGVSSVGTKCTKARVGNGNSQYWKIARFATDEILHSSELEVYNYIDTALPTFTDFPGFQMTDLPSNNMRAVHISTCPTNAPNKWRKLQKKHHMVDVTLCSWAMGWSHMNISPRPVHAGLVSSIESSKTDFIFGRWLWSARACLWVIWVLRHLRNQNINTEII